MYDDAMPSQGFPAIAVAALLASASCGGSQDAPGPDTLTVAPATAALIVGDTAQVGATFQRDGADVAGGPVTWSSSDPGIAAVEARDARAAIIAVGAGAAAITASGSGLTAMIAVTVSPVTLTGIAIMPEAPTVPAGVTITVSVIATYNNLTTVEVATQAAWVSDAPSIATVTGRVLTAFTTGETTITATYMSQVSRMRVVVTDPVLRSIDVVPANASVLVGATRQFTASGFFSDASRRDITGRVTWASSATAVATISNAAGSQGLAAGLAEGETTISATAGRVIGMTTLTVEPLSLGAKP